MGKGISRRKKKTLQSQEKENKIDRLVALPVAGDAFLLIRGANNLLVDGGMSGRVLYSGIREELGADPCIQRIICTHNDSDHAEGIAKMLFDLSCQLTVGEVWLPGSWSDPLFVIATEPSEIFDKVISSVESALKSNADGAMPSELGNALDGLVRGVEISEASNDVEVNGHNAEPNVQKRKGLEVSIRMAIESCGPDLHPFRYRHYSHLSHATQRLRNVGLASRRSEEEIRAAVSLCMHLINAGERIFEIAKGSINRGATLRWFDAKSYYDQSAPRKASGGDGDLIPLNSVELIGRPDTSIDLGTMLFLTVINQHSLVFYAPETNAMPGAIFSADGLLDVDKLILAPKKKIVVTAPHHGSASNVAAYTNLAKVIGAPWNEKVILVRSDRHVRANPCLQFKQANMRLCTICPQRDFPTMKVKLIVESPNREWGMAAAKRVRGCDCI